MSEKMRADLTGVDKALSDVLDDWLWRQYQMTVSHSGYDSFRRLLAEQGYQITRTPRVWLDDDTVPAGVWVYGDNEPTLREEDQVWMPGEDGEDTGICGFGDVVEVVLPDDTAGLIKAEKARRAADPTQGR